MLLFENRACLILYNAILSVGKRDRYLLPANVCPIVPAVFLKAGVPFSLIDIDPATLCMDENAAIEAIRSAPSLSHGMLFVRTYGTERAPRAFFSKVRAEQPDAFLIDDKCLCLPRFSDAEDDPADLVLYSTGYSKYVDLGRGGFAFLRANEGSYRRQSLPYRSEDHERLVAAMAEAIRNETPFRPADSSWLGDSSSDARFDDYRSEVEAALVPARKRKDDLNAVYAAGLPETIQLAPEHQVWRFTVRVPDKEALLRKIFAAGLFASSHYHPLARVYGTGKDAAARSFHASAVNLFNDYRFDADRAASLCRIINNHLEAP